MVQLVDLRHYWRPRVWQVIPCPRGTYDPRALRICCQIADICSQTQPSDLGPPERPVHRLGHQHLSPNALPHAIGAVGHPDRATKKGAIDASRLLAETDEGTDCEGQ